MSSEKRKIAYIDGKPYEIGSNHTSILKFVKAIQRFKPKAPSNQGKGRLIRVPI